MGRNLIVFDLEWNIGYQPKTFRYHDTELTLRGEIIQIGAVRISESGEVLDTFEITLRPRIFRKLQRHIAKVTGMSQGDLDAGVPIAEGLARFVKWAGPDAEFAEWGLDDVPVLKQNLYLVGMDDSWPHTWYDIQRLFLREHPRKEGEGMTLERVVERLGLPMDRPFHDALADALYTVDVCAQLNLEEGLAQYPTEAQQLQESLCVEPEAEYLDFRHFTGFLDKEGFRTQEEIQTISCPQCGELLDPAQLWLKRGNTGYYTLSACPQGHQWLVRIKLMRRDGLHWSVGRCLERPTPSSLGKWEEQKKKYLIRLQKAAEKAGKESTDPQ